MNEAYIDKEYEYVSNFKAYKHDNTEELEEIAKDMLIYKPTRPIKFQIMKADEMPSITDFIEFEQVPMTVEDLRKELEYLLK